MVLHSSYYEVTNPSLNYANQKQDTVTTVCIGSKIIEISACFHFRSQFSSHFDTPKSQLISVYPEVLATSPSIGRKGKAMRRQEQQRKRHGTAHLEENGSSLSKMKTDKDCAANTVFVYILFASEIPASKYALSLESRRRKMLKTVRRYKSELQRKYVIQVQKCNMLT
ncbi:hypothetical protein AKJ16_DCAP24954, partial [Drosera capensis]